MGLHSFGLVAEIGLIEQLVQLLRAQLTELLVRLMLGIDLCDEQGGEKEKEEEGVFHEKRERGKD